MINFYLITLKIKIYFIRYKVKRLISQTYIDHLLLQFFFKNVLWKVKRHLIELKILFANLLHKDLYKNIDVHRMMRFNQNI